MAYTIVDTKNRAILVFRNHMSHSNNELQTQHYFAKQDHPENCFRLGITSIPNEKIREGVRKLAEIIHLLTEKYLVLTLLRDHANFKLKAYVCIYLNRLITCCSSN
jgi:hypothetical protein